MVTLNLIYKTDNGSKKIAFTGDNFKAALAKEQDYFKGIDYDLVQRLIEETK